ncbi:MAG: hypothetical protein ACU0DI_10410 [Paracoccaceae bacterium]
MLFETVSVTDFRMKSATAAHQNAETRFVAFVTRQDFRAELAGLGVVNIQQPMPVRVGKGVTNVGSGPVLFADRSAFDALLQFALRAASASLGSKPSLAAI